MTKKKLTGYDRINLLVDNLVAAIKAELGNGELERKLDCNWSKYVDIEYELDAVVTKTRAKIKAGRQASLEIFVVLESEN